jgi:HK97 family phage portal protein
MSNRLGRVLRYLTEAVDYAAVPWRQSPVSSWAMALSTMGERDRWGTAETLDVDAALRLAVTSAWTYAAIKLIADRIASADARPVAKRREGDKLVNIDNHPFEQLLYRPNSLMTTDYLLSYTTWWTYLLGNAYIFIATQAPGYGVPEELWPLPANMVKPLPGTLRRSRLTGGSCIDYEYTIGTKKYTLPGENMIHIRLSNPFDYWNGLSPLSAALAGIRTDHAQAGYIHSYYTDDNAVPPAIISLPAETSKPDFLAAVESIRSQAAGRQRTLITRNGDISVQILQQTLDQMQHVETRKFNREQIFLVYGIPEGMITGGVSGDSRLATEIAFTRNTVQPFLNRIASEMTANLAPYYGRDIVIDAPIIIPQDRALAIQEFSTYALDRTINENREVLDLPPIDLVAILKEINSNRKGLGLDEIELADASLPLMIALPTRLHAYISSNTFMAAVPPAFANGEIPPETGDLPGMMGPDNFSSDQAVRAAQQIAVTTELKRWEKVASKEARDGRDPAAREFSSAVLADWLIDTIRQRIVCAPESMVKEVFDAHIRAASGGTGNSTAHAP